MSGGPEFTDVEQPFLNQLASMGWKIITGSVDHPSVTGRESFREVLIKPDLRKRTALASTSATAGPGSTTRASPRPSAPWSASATLA